MKAVALILFAVLYATTVATYRKQTWYYKVVAKIMCNGTPVKRGVGLNFFIDAETVNTVHSPPQDDEGFIFYSGYSDHAVPLVPDLKVQFVLPGCLNCKPTETTRNLENFLFLEPKYTEQYPLNVTDIEITKLCKKTLFTDDRQIFDRDLHTRFYNFFQKNKEIYN